MKQVIVMRKDLNMRAGKMAAQAGHAVLGSYLEHKDDPRVTEWLAGEFKKICVRVESEGELMDIMVVANAAGILVGPPIVDNGHTEFHGVPTLTCVALGPDTDENLDPVTGELRLL